MLEGVAAAAADLGVSASLVRRIFRELISDSVAQQTRRLNGEPGGRVRVAFQGVAHAYSDAAAQKYLAGRGLDGDLTGYRTFREAAGALIAGQADLAVLPIENTTAGSINEVYALLREHELFIIGEETWKVDHCLAGVADVPLTSLSRILSHPQGLEQCSQFLLSVPQATPTSYFDTAEAVRAVAEAGDPATAAIGSADAAAAYGLVVLRHNISDRTDNYTRFVVLSRTPSPVDLRIPCKTSLILVTGHEEGDLLRCLEVLSGSGHSMTKLESRPRPGRPWEYMFFVDFEGNTADPRTAAALDELRAAALYVKILGSYPAKALRAPTRRRLPVGRVLPRSPIPNRGRRAGSGRDAGGRGRRARSRPGRSGPGTTSSSTGPPARTTRSSPSATCSSAGTASWSWPARARWRARSRSPRRPGSWPSTARGCCAAACSSRGPRRTRSRAWAGTAWTCSSPPGGRPGCRSSPR